MSKLLDKMLAVVDVETTGLNPAEHEIIEIAVLLAQPSGEVVSRWSQKIIPTRLHTATPKALEVNGYTPGKWAGAGPAKAALLHAAALVENTIWIGKNPNFDRDFLVEALKREGIHDADKQLPHRLVDVTALAWEHLVPCGLETLGLEAITKFLGIPHEAHTAIGDVEATYEVYKRLLRAGPFDRLWWRLKHKENPK